MRSFLKKLLRDTGGNALILSGAGAVALVGGAGLGVDTVEWYLWKRQLQQSVDSGALAGSNALVQGSGFRTYAAKELNRNANTDINVVRIANPPLTGAFTGDNGAVEVIASTQHALPFSSVFVATAPTITARAVATVVVDGEHCVIALAPDGVGVGTQGAADVQLGCGVAANSRGLTSIDLDGTSFLRASPLSARGGIQFGNGNITPGTTVQAYGVKQKDPLEGLYDVPTHPAGCSESNYTVHPNTTRTLSPPTTGPNKGFMRMCNGLTVRGTLYMNPGVYIIDRGEFLANSQAKIVGQGVTIVLTGNSGSNVATVDIAGGAEIDLRAPNSDDEPTFPAPEWYGMLFYQDPDADAPMSKINGDSDLKIEGIIYMPGGDIRFNGSSGQHSECLLLVANRVTFAGETSLDNTCHSDIDKLDLGARIVRVVE